ncbi:MAG: histidine kinase [Ignavibacteriales bacterium]|nr:histidine kinase [Ignavibacteriales bacterium]
MSALTQIDPTLSTVMTEKLAKFIRLSLENKELMLIPLCDEIENIKDISILNK